MIIFDFIKNEMIFYKLFVWSAMRWKILPENADRGAAAAIRRLFQ